MEEELQRQKDQARKEAEELERELARAKEEAQRQKAQALKEAEDSPRELERELARAKAEARREVDEVREGFWPKGLVHTCAP